MIPHAAFAGARRFAQDERGAGTMWMIFWAVVLMMIGGVAVDTSKAWRMRAMLQAGADSAAHAGAIAQAGGGDPVVVAIDYARAHFDPEAMGEVLVRADVTTGTWNPKTRGLDADAAGPPDSVRVVLRRADANGNPEPATFLRLVGLMDWDISASSTARRFVGLERDCQRRGLVARGVVDLQSNNTFRNICIAGRGGMKVNNGNDWTTNVVVAIPSLDDLQIPGSNPDTHNPGLLESLVFEEIDPTLVDSVREMIENYMAGFQNENGVVRAFRVERIENASDIDFAAMNADPLKADTVFVHECLGSGRVDVSLGSGGGGNGNGNGNGNNGNGNGKARKKADGDDDPADDGDGAGVIEGVRFMTDCSIKFAGGVTLVNSVFGTTGDAAQGGSATVSAPSSLTLGRDDGCAAGGGSRILVDGDFRASAKLAMHGSQIIATGDVKLAAQANGLDGVSVLSGGDIDVSSNNGFGTCDGTDFAAPGFDYAVVN